MADVEHNCTFLVQWFRDDYMTLNAEQKCHLLVSAYKSELMFAKVEDALSWEENLVKLLGLFIDSDLSFHGHVKVICKKASQKLSATARVANVISNHKNFFLIKPFLNLNSATIHYFGCFLGAHSIGV